MEINVKKEGIFPVKIIYSENVQNAETLLKERIVQVVAPNVSFARLEKGGRIVLDFGKEVHGGLRILVNEMQQDRSASKVRISLGESVAEAITPIGKDGANNYHSVRDGEYYLPWNCDFITSRTGFRFACIELLDSDYIEIACVIAETEMPILERKGFFTSNDDTLNKIAETAAYTATLCVQNDVIWDGIKRDRLVWMGDLHPEILTLASMYGAIPQIKNCLEFIDLYFPHAWANSIPAYSAWWMVCLYEYFMMSADSEYVKKKIPYIHKILEAFDKIILDDGTVSYEKNELYIYEGNEFYFDWPTNFTEDSKVGWASLIKFAMDKASFLLMYFEEDCTLANKLSGNISKNPMFASSFKQVEAFNLLSGRKTADEVKAALLNGAGKGMTGFMGYYILTATASCGGGKEVLDMIKEYYGGMISLGATSFWEDFDVEWLKDNPQAVDEMPCDERKNIHRDYGKFCYKQLRHSLCHGWTAGVYAFLTQAVLGITAIEPGYKKVAISPNLIGLNRVEGSVPTPYGEIYVLHELVDGKICSKIQAPKEIEIIKA